MFQLRSCPVEVQVVYACVCVWVWLWVCVQVLVCVYVCVWSAGVNMCGRRRCGGVVSVASRSPLQTGMCRLVYLACIRHRSAPLTSLPHLTIPLPSPFSRPHPLKSRKTLITSCPFPVSCITVIRSITFLLDIFSTTKNIFQALKLTFVFF